MRVIRELMTTDVVWVNPSAKVKAAVILMKAHGIGALPVIHNGDGLVGLVTLQNLVGEPPDALVSDLMRRDFVTVEPTAGVHEAAEIMSETGARHLLVIEEGRLAGIVSTGDIMPELGRTYDPLTRLPWSDTFREWAMDALKSGSEISVILFDLDQFGKFNKRHGHVVGDRVLQAAAEVFKNGTDPALDLVCRYGGDEFAIATLRLADEAETLARDLQQKIARLEVPGLPEGVTATWGMFGGRRTKEREDMHFAATIDDLVTRASKNCIKNKPWVQEQTEVLVPAEAAAGTAASPESTARGEADRTPEMVSEPVPLGSVHTPEGPRGPLPDAKGSRLKIDTISYSSTGSEARAGVVLKRGTAEYKREVSGYTVGGNSILRLFAEATAGAVCKALAPEHGIIVQDAAIQNFGEDDQVVTVIAVYVSPRQSTRLAGSALVRRGDQYRAAAAALLDAVNRQIELAPVSTVDDFDQVNPG